MTIVLFVVICIKHLSSAMQEKGGSSQSDYRMLAYRNIMFNVFKILMRLYRKSSQYATVSWIGTK